MIEIADVFRRFGAAYLDSFGSNMLPSHHRVIADIQKCRTEALGGHVFRCDSCNGQIFSYHSCKNRHCPKCHTAQTRRWLEQRQGELLPISYFHVTVTVPEALRSVFRSNQVDAYGSLMQASAAAILELAQDPRYVGGMVGILMVLHTWTQQLIHHPHVHCLVTGGGVSADGKCWHPAPPSFLFPVRALSRLIRGKVMAHLKRVRPDIVLPPSAWCQEWVVHCTPWGTGEQAVLDYLARYAFRIAITNCRILEMDETTVTFRFKERKKRRWRACRLTGEEFLRRFLQHVLPRGFHKVRYFGLWHPTKRETAQRVRLMLAMDRPSVGGKPVSGQASGINQQPSRTIKPGETCPQCAKGKLVLCRSIPKPMARSP